MNENVYFNEDSGSGPYIPPGETSNGSMDYESNGTSKALKADVKKDVVSFKAEYSPPSADFLKRITSMRVKFPEQTINSAWEIYQLAEQRVLFQGDLNSWQGVSVYYFFLEQLMDISSSTLLISLPFPVEQLLSAFSMSVVEFFDKLLRLITIMRSSKEVRLRDYITKMQESLALSTIIYKKFVSMFRIVFTYLDRQQAVHLSLPPSKQIFDTIWTSYLLLRRLLKSEDLVSCFNLLLCLMDFVYEKACVQGLEGLLNQKFAQELLDDKQHVMQGLCKRFNGILLDAKHFRAHCFTPMLKEDTQVTLNQWDIRDKSFGETLNSIYDRWLLSRGQVDERQFIPRDKFQAIFDASYEDTAMNHLVKDPKSDYFKDAELLMNVSIQKCLGKLDAGNEVASVLGLLHTGVESEDTSDAVRYLTYIQRWNQETSVIKLICDQMTDSPWVTLLLTADGLAENFARKIKEESESDKTFDVEVGKSVDKLKKVVNSVILILIERIVEAEVSRTHKEEDLANILRKEDFVKSIACIAIELILFCSRSKRVFPWSSTVTEVHPFEMHKIIQLVVNYERRLGPSLVQHLNLIESRCIEELSWCPFSNLWSLLKKYPLKNLAPFNENWLAKGISPLKVVGQRTPRSQATLPKHLVNFVRNVFLLSAIRLNKLCGWLKMDQKSRNSVWTLFDEALRSETNLFLGRHLDQNLLCCIYMVTRINQLEISFADILKAYRKVPGVNLDTYRQVLINNAMYLYEGNPAKNDDNVPTAGYVSGERANIIQYYNTVFSQRLKGFVLSFFDENSLDESYLLPLPIPPPENYQLDPAAHVLPGHGQVTVVPLNEAVKRKLTDSSEATGELSFGMFKSPRKDFNKINGFMSVLMNGDSQST